MTTVETKAAQIRNIAKEIRTIGNADAQKFAKDLEARAARFALRTAARAAIRDHIDTVLAAAPAAWFAVSDLVRILNTIPAVVAGPFGRCTPSEQNTCAKVAADFLVRDGHANRERRINPNTGRIARSYRNRANDAPLDDVWTNRSTES